MKTRIKNIEDCKKILQVEISKETVQKTVEEVYENIKKIAKIPGFRPGFAPSDLIKKHHSGNAKEEVLRILIPEGYRKALSDHKVVPIGEPRVFNIAFDMDKDLKFEAEVETYPKFKIKNYTGIKVKKSRVAITPKEIDDAILRARNLSAKYENVERAAQKGDYLICDVEAFIDGKSISKKTNNMWVQAEKDASLLGMGEELIGLKKGDSKEVESKLPENYPDKKYSGKTTQFKIEVKEVKEKIMPEANDELAKTLNMENMDALKKEIETQLLGRKENTLKIDMENQIITKLLKDNEFSVPPGIIERQKKVFEKRMEVELVRQEIPKEEIEKRIKELDSKIKSDAKDKVKLYFILDDIAQKENVEVDDSDIENKIAIVAASTGRPSEEIKKYYEDNHLMGGLFEEVKEEKVMDFLIQKADISEL